MELVPLVTSCFPVVVASVGTFQWPLVILFYLLHLQLMYMGDGVVWKMEWVEDWVQCVCGGLHLCGELGMWRIGRVEDWVYMHVEVWGCGG